MHRKLSVHSGSQIAWAIRKNSPALMKSISAFANTVKKGSLLGNMVRKRYLGSTGWLETRLCPARRIGRQPRRRPGALRPLPWRCPDLL